MRFALLLAAGTAVLAGPTLVRAQETGDEVSAAECCVRLLYPIGARALALGNALTARAMPDALSVNPAGIAGLELGEFRVHSERTDLAKTTTFAAMFGVGNVGTAAISYRLVDIGETEATDENNNVTGTLRLTDQMVAASFATSFVPHLDAGVTYMLYQMRNDCSGFCGEQSFAGTTHAVDVGLRLDVPWVPSLELGAAAIHLGLPLQVKNAPQSDPTPARLHFGAAYELLQHFRADSTMKLIASAELVRGVRDGIETAAAAGLELSLDGSLFLRGGYASGSGKGTGASIGVGLIWDRFDVGVAKSFAAESDGSEPFQVTFAIRF